MAITLYDLSVASYLQTLGAVEGFLEKGRKHCSENGIDLNEIVETRLYPDMLPFRFQIVSIAHHSLGAIEGVMAGQFQPPAGMGEFDYAALQKLAADARTELQGYSPEDVNAREGQEVIFQMGEHRLPFTAENFVLSFSMPNFYFHATTAYDILRMKGVPVGKRDFMGPLRLNR
jgi:hypothetical protein